jgi:hypothetical protein
MQPSQNFTPNLPEQPIEEPVVSHSPGQVFGPGDSSAPGTSFSATPPPVPIDPMPTDRPMAVASMDSIYPTVHSGLVATGPTETVKSRRFSKKKLLILASAFLVVLGSGASAFFGYYVPSKPQNVLVKAINNTLSQHQFTTTGTLDVTSSDVSGKVDYTIKADSDNHATDSQLDITISGVKVPLELVTVKGNVYFKFGSLSGLSGVLNGLLGDSSQAKSYQDQLNSKVANQWVEADSTILKEAKISCLGDYPAPFSQFDIKALQNAYKQNQFVTITSRGADSVNGQSAYKYQLQIDDNKLANFDPSGSDYFKRLKTCLNSVDQGSSGVNSLKDNDKTPLTLWVDKKTKTIVKYASQATSQDKKNGVDANLIGMISYGKVNISAPANPKSVMDLLGDLDLSALDSLGASSSGSAADTERKTDINALHGQLEAYQAENGFYPTLANLNNASWRASNLQGFDDQALKDPAGTAKTLAGTPAAHVYSYQALPAGCNNTNKQCTDYTLTATLDDGSTYQKQALNFEASGFPDNATVIQQ